MVLMFICGLLPVIRSGRHGVMTGMISLGLVHGCSMLIATSCRNRRVCCHCLQRQDQHQQPDGDVSQVIHG